jgi:hypothetical protein
MEQGPLSPVSTTEELFGRNCKSVSKVMSPAGLGPEKNWVGEALPQM